MKTLILYATKHGGAADIARRIADKMGDATLHNLSADGRCPPPLQNFNNIILGSSIYAGAIRKELKGFLAKIPSDTKIQGIFLSSFEENDEYFTKNFPTHILGNIRVKAFLGGIFDPSKAGGIERTIVKAVMKQTKYTNTITDEKITQFVKQL